MSTLFIVGTGPGATGHLTEAAREAIASADYIVGYGSYVELVRPLLEGKQIIATGMMQEVQRCREAIRLARAGESVALVSGGDSGIYGMAGLVLELVEADARANVGEPHIDVRIIPGISAVQAAAAQLGAPLMHDFAVISLSDLLTPWPLIKKRLAAAAAADFVIAIYNPRSKSRTTQIEEARSIILTHRPPQTPVGIVRNACRDGQEVVVTTLNQMLEHHIDMTSIVLIGNASSFIDAEGRIVTPRGYAAKYGPDAEVAKQRPSLNKPAAVMFCGTASDVGKSILTAGLCRYLVRRGYSVAPFKSQNMSLNSFVTPQGGEIGRAQAVQAEACLIAPHTDMNPVLLKPNSDTGSQIVVQGRPVANMSVSEYDRYKPVAFEKITESFQRLRSDFSFIVLEGAGSISEINLRHNDIANMKIAALADCPVILVADIDRGGVFAQIAGTIDLLEPDERSRIKGIIINKFRGDASLLQPGIDFIVQRTGVPVLGVLPWIKNINLPDEDSVALCRPAVRPGQSPGEHVLHVGVIRLPRISNFTDFDPLRRETDVHLSYVDRAEQLHGLDVLIIPGSKSTIADLAFLRERGLYGEIRKWSGRIVGICGGFQMLGTTILDPDGVESSVSEAQGLELLPSITRLLSEKATHQVQARLTDAGGTVASPCHVPLIGYEIHMGVTTLAAGVHPFSHIFVRGGDAVAVDDGGVSLDGRIFGTYLHGIFDNDQFRVNYLNTLRREKGMPLHSESERQAVDDPFDQLAEQLEEHLDMPALLGICGLDCDAP